MSEKNQPLTLAYIKANSLEDPHTGCWMWQRYIDNRGRAKMRVQGEIKWIHREAWQLYHNRKFRFGSYACHTCDRPACVNPLHIYEGDAGTNRRDAIARNRIDRAKLKTNKVVSLEIVQDIRSKCKPHKSYTGKMKELAVEYGIAYTTVRDIVWHRTWKDV